MPLTDLIIVGAFVLMMARVVMTTDRSSPGGRVRSALYFVPGLMFGMFVGSLVARHLEVLCR